MPEPRVDDLEFWSPEAVRERLKTFELTDDMFGRIAKLPPKKRRAMLDYVGRMEWEKCAADIIYWLTPEKHFKSAEHPNGTPYVYTQERKTLYECVACKDGLLYDIKKQPFHLSLRHGVKAERSAEIQSYFKEADRTRIFNLLPYMPEMIEWWQREPVVFIEKSRDMMATWLVVTCYAWDTLFHRNKQNCFQSLTANKTLEATERVFFIWKNQPAFLKRQHKVEFSAGTSRSGSLKVLGLGSEIIGLPRGADQIRQYHPSGVFTDETAFHVEAAGLFTAIKPSIMNGGRYTAVSSANPGWFFMAVTDRLEDY